MVDIQKTQEWIDLIRPWDDIRNVGYTSRRINQKMQVMNTYLDSDKAESHDYIPEPEWSWDLSPINHFTHTVLWKNDFWAKGQWNIYIPSSWTYILKCTFTSMPVDQSDEIIVDVIKNWDIDSYPQDIILNITYIAPWGYQAGTISEMVIVNLEKWDVLTVWAYIGAVWHPYPVETRTTINLIKLS